MSKSKSKKVNPRRIPATQMDVKRAKMEAIEKVVTFTKIITFQGLLDEGVIKPEDVERGWNRVISLAESVNKGYVKYEDMYHAMIEDYGVDLAKRED